MSDFAEPLLQHLANARNRGLAPVGAEHLADTTLLEYIDGLLDDAAEQQARAHLGACHECMKSVLLLRAHRANRSNQTSNPELATPQQQPALHTLRNQHIGWAAAAAIALVVAALLFPQIDAPLDIAVLAPQPSRDAPSVLAPKTNSVPNPQTEPVADISAAPHRTAPSDPGSSGVPAAAPPLHPQQLVAVVIANADYSAVRLPPATAALRDAEEVRHWLENFGVPRERTIYLENASSARLNEVFGNRDQASGILSQTVTADTDVLVYYSGHAVPDLNSQRPYLLPVDTDPNYAALSGYALDTLLRNVGALNARSVTVVLETSFAGTVENKALFRGISPGLIDVALPATVPDRITVLAGADRGQANNAVTDARGHIFTRALLRALDGAADSNGDRVVSLRETADFVQHEVQRQARRGGTEQSPWIRGVHERGLVTVH